MDEAVWDEMIDINLTGQWKTIRAAVPHIIAGGQGGSVVITSSRHRYHVDGRRWWPALTAERKDHARAERHLPVLWCDRAAPR